MSTSPSTKSGRSALPGAAGARGTGSGVWMVAASAYAGAVGLGTGTDPCLRHVTDRLPFRSPMFGAAALVAAGAVPHTSVARYAWRGDARTDQSAVVAGTLLVGWIGVEAIVIREKTDEPNRRTALGAVACGP